ncbi:hypothetical protein VP01_1578g3 [Puccinia sorghi]|uniref:Uncharacterized protein n=1 Tax=Puccinia sorghi TaxID=27349 RepID=A0A0L6VHU7_9BASI|nr:hypothetical protein VP01_1578g3 [Puccinia sorghi]
MQKLFNQALMHSHCADHIVNVPKHLHRQTCGVWMAAWLQHAACQLQAVDQVLFAVIASEICSTACTLMHSDCAYCTVTVPKHLHMQTGGVWMTAWLEHAARQLHAVEQVCFSVAPSTSSSMNRCPCLYKGIGAYARCGKTLTPPKMVCNPVEDQERGKDGCRGPWTTFLGLLYYLFLTQFHWIPPTKPIFTHKCTGRCCGGRRGWRCTERADLWWRQGALAEKLGKIPIRDSAAIIQVTHKIMEVGVVPGHVDDAEEHRKQGKTSPQGSIVVRATCTEGELGVWQSTDGVMMATRRIRRLREVAIQSGHFWTAKLIYRRARSIHKCLSVLIQVRRLFRFSGGLPPAFRLYLITLTRYAFPRWSDRYHASRSCNPARLAKLVINPGVQQKARL